METQEPNGKPPAAVGKPPLPGAKPSAPCCAKQKVQLTRNGIVVMPTNLGRIDAPWTDGVVETAVGAVPRARTELSLRDRLATARVRCAIGRMSYRVPPGLYAVGDARADSPVMVSANYKLSFDLLRRALSGHDAWILVLDTKGINVWCAAGKGTFGTDEIVRRVRTCGLDRIVSHHRLVVPQLGATGVSAHQVRDRCGFHVTFGPVRVQDLPAFLDAGMKAEPEMRRVRFDLRDRVTLIPVELVNGAKYFLLGAAALLLLSGLNRHGYALTALRGTGLAGVALVLGAYAASTILGATLLPWLPGRAFAVKGAALGILLVGVTAASGWLASIASGSWLHAAAWALIVPAIASYTLMTFTGSSTFTSLSGVLREMRIAVPAQIAGGAIGLGLWVTGLFLGGGR
jgi:acetyl-CoA decarbonylase/synthase complex subunit gamma